MSQGGDDLVFDGVKGTNSGAFVRFVRQEALQKGNQKDDEWIAQLAASYLDGDALEWYESLEEDVQESWKLLRRVLLQKWPVNQPLGEPPKTPPSSDLASASGPMVSIAPTPAAAPSLARTLSPASGPRTGRIKVILDDGTQFGWLSGTPDKEGDFGGTGEIGLAMTVQFNLEPLPHRIKILPRNATKSATGSWLGLLLEDVTGFRQTFNDGAFLLGGLTTLQDNLMGRPRPLSSVHKGEAIAAAWNVLMDGTLVLSWGGPYLSCFRPGIEIVMTPGQFYGQISTVNQYGRLHNFIREYKTCHIQKARLVFESL